MEYFPNNITSEIEEPTSYKPNESHPSYYKMTTEEFQEMIDYNKSLSLYDQYKKIDDDPSLPIED